MARKARFVAIAVALLLAAGSAFAYMKFRQGGPPATYQGYVEGEYLRIAAPEAGTLKTLSVRRGESVAAGAPLFSMDLTADRAVREEAAAALIYAEAQLRRQEELLLTKATPVERVDAARSAFAKALAAYQRAERRLAEMAPVAPAAALVEDTMAQPGDFVQAGAPIVSLLPPDRVKLRFYVPERALAQVAVGGTISFRCDGCPAGLRARIVYVSPRAEYTPPVIYSAGSRDKLVFLVEAKPIEPPLVLKPGQPVDVVAGTGAGAP